MLKANSYYVPPQLENNLFTSIDDREIRERASSFDRYRTNLDDPGSGEDLGYLCRRILAGDEIPTSQCFGYRQLFGKSLVKPQVTNVTPHAVSKSLSIFIQRILIKSSQRILKDLNSLKKYKIFEREKLPSLLQKRFESLSNRFNSSRRSISPEDITQQQQLEIPSLEIITEFIFDVCTSTQMEYECSVASLIYLQRFMEISYHHLQFNEYNWRSIVLSSLLIANKMWDDFHVANVAYCLIFPGLSLERVNQLEIGFLEVLEYKTWISPSCYAENHFAIQACIAEEEIKQMKLKYSSTTVATGTQKNSIETKSNGLTPSSRTLTKMTLHDSVLRSSVSIAPMKSLSTDQQQQQTHQIPSTRNMLPSEPMQMFDSMPSLLAEGVVQNQKDSSTASPSASSSQTIPQRDSAPSLGFVHETCQFIERERKTIVTKVTLSRKMIRRSFLCVPCCSSSWCCSKEDIF
jgi:hypothetical protein